jgi:hypothetical protein
MKIKYDSDHISNNMFFERKSMKMKYDSDHINNNMFFERKSITIKYGSGLNKNIFLVLLIEQV